jgi:ABC-type multidrug transport system permease subunit
MIFLEFTAILYAQAHFGVGNWIWWVFGIFNILVAIGGFIEAIEKRRQLL